MTVRMTASRPFDNPRLTADKGGSSVVPGDTFVTDWDHARDLKRTGLAEPADADVLDREPTEPVAPHNQLSVAEHRTVNDRRSKLRGDAAPASDAATASPAGAITSTSVTRAAATGGPRTSAPALPPVPNPTEPAAS